MTLIGMFSLWELLMILIIIFFISLLPLIAIINVLRNDFQGNDKIVWILVILFLPFFGAILYFLIGKNRRIKN